MRQQPSLGGFVIHGNSQKTLGTCLASLQAVCDEVVAVDSGSTDGSAELVRQAGVRHILHPWQGYGAARAVAAEALKHHDYIFFLDADEHLSQVSQQALQAWRTTQPTLPQYTVKRRDWVDAPHKRYLYRQETRTRLVQPAYARWQASMIVHEALPKAERAPAPGVFVEHAFASSPEALQAKQYRYALLWAVRALGEGKRAPRLSLGRQVSHIIRDAVLKGALWRGGRHAWRLAHAVAAYHVKKYQVLKQLQTGAHPHLLAHWQSGNWAALYADIEVLSRPCAPAPTLRGSRKAAA